MFVIMNLLVQVTPESITHYPTPTAREGDPTTLSSATLVLLTLRMVITDPDLARWILLSLREGWK